MLDIGSAHCGEYEINDNAPEPVVVAEAPGRIHYLGEQGEAKAALLLSSAIDRYVRVAVSARKDNSLRFFAADLGERKRTTLVNLKYKREDRWSNYIKAAIHVFAGLGYPVKGLNFTLTGDIPQQIGLASSSAIEVAATLALKGFFKASVSEKELLSRLNAAQLIFFGRDTDYIDYQIMFAAKKDSFFVVDEAAREIRKVKSPFTRYKFLLTDSRVPRFAVEDELKKRQADVKKGLELLSQKKQGINFRNIAASDFTESLGDLPEEIRRRCTHVIREIGRVNGMEEAMKKQDYASISRMIYHSHESLRDLYEVSCPEIDWLVKRAQEIDGILGSRMSGAGFGGCTYTIGDEKALEDFRRRFEDYERIFGFHPHTYEIRPATGARLVSARKPSG
jgi:galactokinase